ncbi:hypothetical protein Tco_0958872 [Tanacetum coccineum]
MQLVHDAEEPATLPHDSSQLRVQSLGSDEGSLTLNELTVLFTTLSKKVKDLQNDLKQTKLIYGAAYTKLILRVKKLEHKVKVGKSRRRARVIISDNEEDLEDSYKQGRIITEIDQNPYISLVQDERTSWIQEDVETQGKTSADTKILDIYVIPPEPTELVENPDSGEKGEKEISTVEVLVSVASVILEVSTAIPERQVYIRRSAEKRKDKGKAIMKDDESVQKKTKKQLEQKRLGHEEAIRLQEQINEEERQRIVRDAEIAKQLQEEIDIERQEQEKYDLAQAFELQEEFDKRKEGVAETTQAHDIDWSDPAVIRYHALQNRSFSVAEVRKNMCMYLKNQGGYKQSHFKRMSYEDIRPIFERVWDQNQSFVPKDSEIEKEVMKRSGFNFQKPPAKRQKVGEVSGFDRDDLEKLWDLVKKKFSSTEPTIDKENVLWVELKRGHDIFMLVEKDYPLTRALMTVMLANKLQVDESSEMENELLSKIFYEVNHKFRGGLLGIKVFYKVYTASSTKSDDRNVTELILKECMGKAQAESSLTKPKTNNNMNIELIKKFLMELQNNAHYGMFDEDVVDHIAKVLEILDLIKIPNVDTHQLRMKVFLSHWLMMQDNGR